MEQEKAQRTENSVPPQVKNVTINNQHKKSHGCLWGLLIFGAVCFVIFGAAGIFGIILRNGLKELDKSGDDQFESYERQYISGNKSARNIILSIPVNGVIASVDESSPFDSSSMASSSKICEYLRMAKDDKSVKAVIMNINSPGGEVVASDQIHHAILEVRNSGKPVIAVIGTMGASGGYYISCACDKIIAHRLSITGSIGVIIQSFKYYDLLNKIGVKSDTYTSCKYKDLLNGARPEIPGEHAIIQDHINKVYDEFIQIVAEGRPQLTYKQLKGSIMTDGRIFLGSEALKLKLIDKLGFFNDGVKTAAELADLRDYKVVAYKRKFSLAALFNVKSSAGNTNINVKLPGGNKDMLEAGKFYYMPIR